MKDLAMPIKGKVVKTPPPKPIQWKAVEGESSAYKANSNKEEIIQGTFLSEFSHKPGQQITRAPYNYFLKTDKAKIPLTPYDMIYLPLKDNRVEVKAKKTKAKDGSTGLSIGWIRTLK